MTDTPKVYLLEVTNTQELAAKPFHFTENSIKGGKVSYTEEFRTNFAFYKAKILTGQDKNKRGIIRDGVFMTRLHFAKDEFKPDTWNNYSYVGDDGKTKNFFEKKFIAEIEFVKPETFQVWNKDTKRNEPQAQTKVLAVFNTSIAKKVAEQLEDPRTAVTDNFVISYEAKNPPATKYGVKFHSTYKVVTPLVTMTTKPTLADHERNLLIEVNGETATPESVIDFLSIKASKGGVTMTPERMQQIAAIALVNGVIRV